MILQIEGDGKKVTIEDEMDGLDAEEMVDNFYAAMLGLGYQPCSVLDSMKEKIKDLEEN